MSLPRVPWTDVAVVACAPLPGREEDLRAWRWSWQDAHPAERDLRELRDALVRSGLADPGSIRFAAVGGAHPSGLYRCDPDE